MTVSTIQQTWTVVDFDYKENSHEGTLVVNLSPATMQSLNDMISAYEQWSEDLISLALGHRESNDDVQQSQDRLRASNQTYVDLCQQSKEALTHDNPQLTDNDTEMLLAQYIAEAVVVTAE